MGGRRKKTVSVLAEELHKPVRRKFKRRRVLVTGIDKIWAADLADMQAFSKFNRGIKYILAVIDVFSKYGYLVPLKDKTGKSVASALKTIFKETFTGDIFIEECLVLLYSLTRSDNTLIKLFVELAVNYFHIFSFIVLIHLSTTLDLSSFSVEYNSIRSLTSLL